MAKAIRFNATFFESGIATFVEGNCYPVTEETLHHVRCGRADEVEVSADETAGGDQAPADDGPANESAADQGAPRKNRK